MVLVTGTKRQPFAGEAQELDAEISYCNFSKTISKILIMLGPSMETLRRAVLGSLDSLGAFVTLLFSEHCLRAWEGSSALLEVDQDAFGSNHCHCHESRTTSSERVMSYAICRQRGLGRSADHILGANTHELTALQMRAFFSIG